MQYRIFGKTGIKLSVFTLGTMRFVHGWDKPHNHLPDDSLAHAEEVVRLALDAGINHIETARGYGKSERLLGRVLPRIGVKRDSYYIMSKASSHPEAGEMRRRVEESLEHMGIDHLDLFAVHGLNQPHQVEWTLRKGGALSALERMRDEGLIHHIGFSSHAPVPLLLETIASGAFSFVNLHHNIFRRETRSCIDMAAARGMGVFVISPNDKGGRFYNPSKELAQLTQPLHPAVLNERWLLSHPEIHTLSIGINALEQWPLHAESLAAQGKWGEAERLALARIYRAGSESPLEACGACRRCLPCPEQINMPDLLRLVHFERSFGMSAFGSYRYGQMAIDDHWWQGADGNLCSDCGDCLPRCPAGIDIPTLVRSAHTRYQPPPESQ